MYRKDPPESNGLAFTGFLWYKPCEGLEQEVPLANYSFSYILGSSKPSSGVQAETDEEAHQEILKFLADIGGTLVPGSIRGQKFWVVADPSPQLIAA